MAKKIELLHTTYDESGNIESQEVVHPLTSPDCVIMENGETLADVMGDGIATPTLTHEGTSFKVGVGDSNIEVVDGDVAGMTLKGQSYQNILPKPTTLIMETDEQEFKINDKIDSNIIIDDNIAEIATVKGKTIVNTVQEESASEYTVLGEDLSGQSITHVKDVPTLEGQTLVNLALNNFKSFTASTDKTAPEPLNKYKLHPFALNMVQPNKEYYLIIHGKYVSGDESANNIRIVQQKQNGDGTNTWLTEKPYLPDTNGWFHIRFTTVDKCSYIGLAMARRADSGAHTSTYIYSSGMLIEYQEGMENWDIPYFEGEKYFESNIKGVTLQGQTLVNTIQEPCENDYVVLGADDGIEISAETGGHGTIENTVQGGLNGAVLEGMTLVNIHPSNLYHLSTSCPNGTFTNVVSTTRELSFTVSLDPSTGWYYMGGGLLNLTFIKPSTKYIIMFDKCDGVLSVAFANANSLNTIAHNTPIQINKHGIPYSIVTTLDEYVEDTQILYLVPKNVVGTKVHVTNARIFEYQNGLENLDIPYFEGMKSVQMPVVKTTGKNLFDINKINTNYINFNDNSEVTVENNKLTIISKNNGRSYVSQLEPLCLKPNTRYAFSITGSSTGDYKRVHLGTKAGVDNNQYKTIVFNEVEETKKIVFTTDDTGYLFIHFYPSTNSIGTSIFYDMQLEEDSVATSYEPYQSSTVSINDYVLNSTQFEQGTISESKEAGKTYEEMLPTGYMDIRLRSKSLFKIGGNAIRGTLNEGYAIFFGFFKDGKYLAKYSSWMDSTNFSVDVPYECNEFCIVLRKNISDTINVSEYDLIGLTLEQVVKLRRIGDVKDELDLQTGKLTQRIGEIVLDGTTYTFNQTPAEVVGDNVVGGWSGIYGINAPKKTSPSISGDIPTRIYTSDGSLYEDKEYFMVGINTMILSLSKTRLNGKTIAQYLANNPITVQYELATPIIKTIDLQVTDQDGNTIPHVQTQPTVTHITASSDYLIPTVTIDNNLAYDTIIKPSTLYTIRFKHDTVNADNPLTVDLGGTVQEVTSTEFTITTPSELTHNQLVFSGKNNVVSEVQVIESDVTNIEYPFFEGMNDVQITDMTRNVNLFDINDTVSGYFTITGGIVPPDHGNLTSNYIKVKPNTTYVYNHGGFVADFADYWTAIRFYKDNKGSASTALQDVALTTDKNGKTYYIQGGRYTVTGKTGYNTFQFTTSSDCEYIRIGSRGLSYDGAWVTLYQLDNFDDSKLMVRNCPFIFGKGGRL